MTINSFYGDYFGRGFLMQGSHVFLPEWGDDGKSSSIYFQYEIIKRETNFEINNYLPNFRLKILLNKY